MRWVKRIGLFILVLVLGAVAFAIYTVRNSFPQVEGTIQVDGLVDEVEVLRDDLGVPHIYAANSHDLFFAQGFTHAQDRFYQMDFWRHIGAGRLSEMFGSSQVETDMFLRSLGWETLAEEEWASMQSPSRDILQSYADGVNAYLDTHSGSELSLEYAILPLQNPEYEINPWSPVNTLTWAKVMSWDLSSNMSEEISRAVLGKTLPLDQVEQLYPAFPEDHPVVVEDATSATEQRETVSIPDEALTDLVSAGSAADRLWELTGGGFEGIGSNNWVLSGELTESGMPLLANDTHLANQMPSIWYANGLHCTEDSQDCPHQLVGFSFAGTPGVVIGHNGHHAWGVTTEAADTQDLFVERVNPEDPGQYEVDGSWVGFDLREETIEVGGGDDVTYEVRSTRHGPVISETYFDDGVFDGSTTVETPDDYVVALGWQSLETSTLVDAIIGINLATSYEEFREAVGLWDIAAQNVVYADVEGNIAYHSTGEIPVRATGDGRYPVPGWTLEYDWEGTVPFDQMPAMLNPPAGYIESANQPVHRPGSTPLIGIDGAHGYRARRIGQMIEESDAHNVETMQTMQFDARDGGAEWLVPYLLEVDATGDEELADTRLRLEGWSGGGSAFQNEARSTGAAIYQVIWRQTLALTFHDDLPEDEWPQGGSRWFEVVRGLLEEPEDPFWDDSRTVEVETRDDILRRAMRLGRRELAGLLGDDPQNWSWGALHIARFENQTLGQSGIGPIEWLFNRTAPARVGGTESVVNAVGWNPIESYEVNWVPAQRMIVDLGDLDASTFIHTTGQSGHAFAANYQSMLEMWTDGEQGPMPFSRGAVEDITVDTVILAPTG
ncbi:MAG TPA: penicillin acylase family protein [Acidimicrobiia bacterium]|nr:penicillin acylase family protein [Acidimicrobiia bacterium]